MFPTYLTTEILALEEAITTLREATRQKDRETMLYEDAVSALRDAQIGFDSAIEDFRQAVTRTPQNPKC